MLMILETFHNVNKDHPLKNIKDDGNLKGKKYQWKKQKPNENSDVSKNSGFLVNTPNCKIVRWKTIDHDVRPLIEKHTNHGLRCRKNFHNITIERIDFNGIQIINKLNKSIECFARSVIRRDDFNIEFGNKTELNMTGTTYFNKEIAVKVNCKIEEGKFYCYLLYFAKKNFNRQWWIGESTTPSARPETQTHRSRYA